MKKFLVSTIAAAASLLAVNPAHAALNLVTNGSFEVGTEPGNFATVGTGESNITGWSVSNGTVDYIGSYWTAADGLRSIDLAGNSYGTLTQAVNLVANQAYSLTFFLSANPDNPEFPRSVQVGIGGTTQDFSFTGSPSLSNMGWQQQTLNFVAGATGSTLLSFTALNAGTYYGPALDNVSLTAVPEPSTWAMMLLGFGMIGFGVRRRIRSASRIAFA
ncbi:hypothetical protein L288_20380 [Sphingobium quisquiliarum P25]|uniref:DUF642 domain-containing protein n=1 Tax=Sphingobium quisquiliarum P25 TaxID=1329909 RepID=T0GD60_9SPHN|nr:choice-of-anchor C family protein [Sphingobium quisquiliarum]EQA98611.1 hypothetical protein L288_20380 [Sphingobium quisquiliarum P25]